MFVKVGTITNIIENLAPLKYAYKWDNVGLQLGSKEDNIGKIMTTLEITDTVLNEAIENQVNMIVTHHPMIFSPLKNIIKEDIKGRIIYKAIQNNITIYATHTNMDIAPGGLNDYIAKQLGIKEIEVLDITERAIYYKLVVFVPVDYAEKLAEAISIAGAGHIGNYSNCTFRIEGTGTFKPLEGTNPFIGSHGQLEKVKEIRLETIVPEEKMKKVMEALIESHPYEEVAYDIYPLANEGPVKGIGRVGNLDKPTTLKNLVRKIKEQMDIENVRIAGNLNANIESIAVINGSGADFIGKALDRGYNCVITGDVRYHDAQDAISQGINVIDIGHYDSEKLFPEFMAKYLKEETKKKGLKVKIVPSTVNINPFQRI